MLGISRGSGDARRIMGVVRWGYRMFVEGRGVPESVAKLGGSFLFREVNRNFQSPFKVSRFTRVEKLDKGSNRRFA